MPRIKVWTAGSESRSEQIGPKLDVVDGIVLLSTRRRFRPAIETRKMSHPERQRSAATDEAVGVPSTLPRPP